jgi:hypothetical protein
MKKLEAKPGVRVEVTEGSGLDSRRHGTIVDTRTFASLLDGYHRRTLESGWVIVQMDAGYLTTQPPGRLIHSRVKRDPKVWKPGRHSKQIRRDRDEVPSPRKDPHVEREMNLGILEAVWMDSYMNWTEEHGYGYRTGHIPQHVRELSDIPQAVPQSAKKLAAKFASFLVKVNKATLTQIHERASRADGEDADARQLGFYLAMQAAGHGIGWTDNHAPFHVILPRVEWHAYGSKGKVQVEGWVSDRLARKMA